MDRFADLQPTTKSLAAYLRARALKEVEEEDRRAAQPSAGDADFEETRPAPTEKRKKKRKRDRQSPASTEAAGEARSTSIRHKEKNSARGEQLFSPTDPAAGSKASDSFVEVVESASCNELDPVVVADRELAIILYVSLFLILTRFPWRLRETWKMSILGGRRTRGRNLSSVLNLLILSGLRIRGHSRSSVLNLLMALDLLITPQILLLSAMRFRNRLSILLVVRSLRMKCHPWLLIAICDFVLPP